MQRTFTTRRRGISLIEVLMSIFIISIGLLGVAALIPLAHYLANRGATADRAAAAGQAALRTFKTYGMDNPLAWRTAAGVAISIDPAGTSDALKPMQLGFAKKYCLDPRGVTRGITADFPNGGTITMPRLNLINGAGGVLSLNHADSVFCLQDDLNFTVNDNDPTAAPVQTMETSNQKRFVDREFSWLATVVRELPGEQYTLSVAVVQSRNNPVAADEVELDVTFPGGGIGGGDVTLTAVAATAPTLQNLVPGQWIMLSEGTRARWYRVLAVSETSGLARDVTLAGRDWAVSGTAKAAILPGVIGVYERTVRLKTDSPWQP